MELLDLLLQRNVIIALAIGGGLIAVVGNYLLRKESSVDPKTGRFVLRAGYAVSWISVALFIAVGFFGN